MAQPASANGQGYVEYRIRDQIAIFHLATRLDIASEEPWENPPFTSITDFTQLGYTLGKLHAASEKYKPHRNSTASVGDVFSRHLQTPPQLIPLQNQLDQATQAVLSDVGARRKLVTINDVEHNFAKCSDGVKLFDFEGIFYKVAEDCAIEALITALDDSHGNVEKTVCVEEFFKSYLSAGAKKVDFRKSLLMRSAKLANSEFELLVLGRQKSLEIVNQFLNNPLEVRYEIAFLAEGLKRAEQSLERTRIGPTLP